MSPYEMADEAVLCYYTGDLDGYFRYIDDLLRSGHAKPKITRLLESYGLPRPEQPVPMTPLVFA
jgi:hypothetical protein